MRMPVYRMLPSNVRKALLRAYSLLPANLRFGSHYWQIRTFIRAAEAWQSDDLAKWQLERLRSIVHDAYETVSGYRQLYGEAGIRPDDVRSTADLRHLPFVTKELIRDNLKDFTSRAVAGWKRLYRTTAGSTGIPFGFWLRQEDVEREFAFIHTAWERAGWRLGDRSAVLRGAFIGTREKFWDIDPHLNNVLFSTYFLTPDTYPHYRERMVAMGVVHLQAYPSAAYYLSTLVREAEGPAPPPFRLLLVGSENLYDWQREEISRSFPQSRIFSWYGHAEQVLFAPECEHVAKPHLHPLYGIAEILSSGGQEVAEGETGELVGTSLWNRATPFIRYRTMDMAEKGPDMCQSCGRAHQLLNRVHGRLQEVIVTGRGRYISMTAINMHSDVFDAVRQFQFHQSEPGIVEFRIVPRAGFDEQEESRIRRELEAKLGDDCRLVIRRVEQIETPRSGKYRFLVQELPVAFGDR
jgi:phenylacetate-CoA ligase